MNNKFGNWLKLWHYIEIENTQGDITDSTWGVLSEALVDIRPKESDEEVL